MLLLACSAHLSKERCIPGSQRHLYEGPQAPDVPQVLPYTALAASDLALGCSRKTAGLQAGLANTQTWCLASGAGDLQTPVAADADTAETVAETMITK